MLGFDVESVSVRDWWMLVAVSGTVTVPTSTHDVPSVDRWTTNAVSVIELSAHVRVMWRLLPLPVTTAPPVAGQVTVFGGRARNSGRIMSISS